MFLEVFTTQGLTLVWYWCCECHLLFVNYWEETQVSQFFCKISPSVLLGVIMLKALFWLAYWCFKCHYQISITELRFLSKTRYSQDSVTLFLQKKSPSSDAWGYAARGLTLHYGRLGDFFVQKLFDNSFSKFISLLSKTSIFFVLQIFLGNTRVQKQYGTLIYPFNN